MSHPTDDFDYIVTCKIRVPALHSSMARKKIERTIKENPYGSGHIELEEWVNEEIDDGK